MVFTANVIASATHLEPDAVEALCETLARRQHLVRPAGPQRFPDGSPCQRYEVVHALYREVCYWRQAPGRRTTRHRHPGEWLEALFATHLNEAASELAHHFEAGAEWMRAIRYLRQTAATAERRYAHREAADVLRRERLMLACAMSRCMPAWVWRIPWHGLACSGAWKSWSRCYVSAPDRRIRCCGHERI